MQQVQMSEKIEKLGITVMDKKQVHDPLGRSVRRKDGEIVR